MESNKVYNEELNMKTTQILKEAELKINSLFHELGLLEPYGKLDNPDYVTPYEKTVKIITEALAQQQQEDYQEVLDLELMKDENNAIGGEGYKTVRDQFRKELRQAIAEKKGKV
jgi:hypothetical protein